MRFPLRLTADLAIGLATKTLRGATRHHLILHLSPVAGSHSPSPIGGYSSSSASDAVILPSEVCLDAVRRSSAPIVWIGGVEPLLHPEIGRLARRIVDTGRHVFVQTDGALLQRRIHEFRPVSRLFLTVQFDGFEHLHDRRSGREGAFRSAVEGIRTAKLSGFLVCAQMSVHADTTLAELEQLRGVLEARDVDGFIVTPANGFSKAMSAENESQALQSKLRAARDQIRSRRWRLFSRLLNSSLPMLRAIAPSHDAPGRAGTAAADACEESVEAS
ncbi:MAG TPA: radical SAM protein [Candidatus Acidoferrum sp.]|nr:radical SAM protein [Candidatus Acidoferrum sp.]